MSEVLSKTAFVKLTNFPFENREQNTTLARGVQTTVPASTQTTVVTLAANGVRFITKIVCSGHDHAKWEVYVDSIVVITKRENKFTTEFDFANPYRLDEHSVMDVKVTHFVTGDSLDFDATIIGFERV